MRKMPDIRRRRVDEATLLLAQHIFLSAEPRGLVHRKNSIPNSYRGEFYV